MNKVRVENGTYRYLVTLLKAFPLATTADDYEQLLPWRLPLCD